jgi:cell division transport system ATP-binding protein
MPVIEFSEVTKTYGRPGKQAPALEQVSFRLVEGEFCLLMGPSGAGKSTLLKLILAMERPESGTIRVAGRDVHRLTKSSIPYLRRNLGAVFQDFKLLDEATPFENVSLALQVLGLRPREVQQRASEALVRVRVDPELRKPVRQLSGGEQQRVALARALAGRPAILLADEPTGNLDPDLTRDILDQLTEIQREGTTILLATHDPVVRDHATATRFLHLEAGRLIDDVLTAAGREITGEEEAADEAEAPAVAADAGDDEMGAVA